MAGYLITLGIFIAVQIAGGIILLTKLRDGQDALQNDLNKIESNTTSLAQSVNEINVSDARYEERYQMMLQTVQAIGIRIEDLQKQLVTMRGKYHHLSGFVAARFPDWEAYEKRREE